MRNFEKTYTEVLKLEKLKIFYNNPFTTSEIIRPKNNLKATINTYTPLN